MTDLNTYNINYCVAATFGDTECSEGGFGVYGRCSGVCCLF